MNEIVKDEYREFIDVFEWYIGMTDSEDKPVIEKTTFAQVEYKYFEGFNMPRKIVDGKYEEFNVSYDRVKRYMALPSDVKDILRRFGSNPSVGWATIVGDNSTTQNWRNVPNTLTAKEG